MNGYRPIPLNRAGGESYDQGRQMTMEEAQRIAGAHGHVAQRISSGAADPNNGYMGVWAIPTEGGFIPVEQLGGSAPSNQGGPQQSRNPTSMSDALRSPYNQPVASTAQTPRQGIAAQIGQQRQEQVIWPAPPGTYDTAQMQSGGSMMGVAAQMGQQRAPEQQQQYSVSDRLRGPYRAPNDPSLRIMGASPPVMQNPPPSMLSTPERTAQSTHYQFDPNFYGQQPSPNQFGQPDNNNPRFGQPPNLWNGINGMMPWSR